MPQRHTEQEYGRQQHQACDFLKHSQGAGGICLQEVGSSSGSEERSRLCWREPWQCKRCGIALSGPNSAPGRRSCKMGLEGRCWHGKLRTAFSLLSKPARDGWGLLQLPGNI